MNHAHTIAALALVSFTFMSPGCDDGLEPDDQEVEALVDDVDAAQPDEAAEISEEQPDDRRAESDPSAAPYCTGYYNGGNYCLAECWKSDTLFILGHRSVIEYGKCDDAGVNFCNNGDRGGLYQHCWGKL